MRTGYVNERDLDKYPQLKRVKRLEKPEDVATVLEAYMDTRSQSSDTFKKIKEIYTDGIGHYYMVLSDRQLSFDIVEQMNNLYSGNVKITYVTLGTMFPQGISNGLGDLTSMERERPRYGNGSTRAINGFFDIYHNKQVDIPESYGKRKPYLVGRSLNNNYTLADCPRADKISRQHCYFYYDNDELYIEDAESNNGTLVNGRKIAPGEACKLSKGDVIKVVDCELEVN